MLEIIDLAKRYGPVVALDGATFTARPGRIVGFLGPNGAGKTTTMRCIFGLARPDRGEVRWDGRPVDRDGAPAVRLHARAARPLPADARRRAAQLLRPAARPAAARPPNAAAARWLERLGLADRAEVEARGALPRQPAAGPAGGRAGPRPGAARPRRAVLRPRPDRHRDDDRGPPRAGRGRRRRRLLEPPARPRRGHLRGRRDHQPRPDRRRRRHRRAEGRVRPRSHLEVEVVGSDGSWLDGRPTCTSSSASGDRVELLVDRSVDLDEPAARGARRRRGPPLRVRAAEALRAVHGSGRRRASRPRRWRDEPLATIWLVARREILERGRSRGFILSRPVHDRASSSGSFLCRRSSSAATRRRSRSASSSRRRPASTTALEATRRRGSTADRARPYPDRAAAEAALEADDGRRPSSTCRPTSRRRARSSSRRARTRSCQSIVGAAVVGLRVERRAGRHQRRPGRPRGRAAPPTPWSSTRRPTRTGRASSSRTSARCSSSSGSSPSASRS